MTRERAEMSRHVIANVPYIWDGITPTCFLSSLRAILEFYGVKYSPSYLMNVCGLNYGFRYSKETKVAFAMSNPPLGPWEFMAYAAEKIGCKVDFVKDKPWDETWRLLKGYVAKDIPIYMARVNMQHLWKIEPPIPHIVVLCGYDEEKGVVMVHDPALGEVGERIQYMPWTHGLPEGKSGSYAEYNIEDFRKACDLTGTPYQDFGKNGFAVIHPPTERPSISWAQIMDRNARLTLGQVEEVIGKHVGADYTWGPDGIVALAADLERGFGLLEQPAKLILILVELRELPFGAGSGYRLDAHAFVAGLASVTGNRDLEKASYYLRFTALSLEEALAQVDYIMRNQPIGQETLRGKLTRISEVLRRAAEFERKAGESLSRGARG